MLTQMQIKKKTGRPKTVIDWSKFDQLAAIQATQVEIAEHFNISPDALDNAVKQAFNKSFTEYYSAKRCAGLTSLRAKQYELAMQGDRVMLIWLGKNWLGQAERVENINKNEVELVERARQIHLLTNDEKIKLLSEQIEKIKAIDVKNVMITTEQVLEKKT